MSEIKEIIDRCEKLGVMTQAEHDRVMRLIHQDGRIDEEESRELSRVFSLIQSGKLRITEKESGGTDNRSRAALQNAKKLAVERDQAREEAVLAANTQAFEREESKSTETEVQESAQSLVCPVPLAGVPEVAKELELVASASANGQGLTRSVGERIVDPSAPTGNKRIFELETDRFLRINLNGKAWIKTGSMAAYSGMVKFTREGLFEHGLSKFVKKQITNEGTMLTKASGQGTVYIADQGKKISVIELTGETIVVNGHDLLAFEEDIKWDIKFLKKIAAMWAGGLFNVHLGGLGMVAISTHYDPVTLRVKPNEPVMTDANATVAWSGNLMPKLRTDVAFKTFVGRTSGETLQLVFQGEGFVVVQPYEELVFKKDMEG